LIGILTWLIFFSTVQSQSIQIPELNWEERSDWINVKTDVTPGAVGDGAADDYAAIQAALNLVSDNAGASKTVYLPPGTFRITQTLSVTQHHHVWLVGHGSATRIVWDGPADASARMYWSNGCGYSRYEGMIWDGAGKAVVGIDHDSKTYFETEIDHKHMAFLNFTDAAIRVGHDQFQASAEMIFSNLLFENCERGLSILTFNDYDNVIDGCEFRNCGTGVYAGTGCNFYLRNSHFNSSRDADITGANPEHPCSIRRCTSIGSNVFLNWSGGVSTLDVQDCHVSEWTNTDGAMIVGGSPMIIFDCTFTNPPANNAPIRLTNANQHLVHCNNLSASTDAVLEPASPVNATEIPAGQLGGSITSAEQRFFKSQVNIPGRVFDAKRDFGAAGDGNADDTEEIQAAIDAARNQGQGAIAYLPRGRYRVSSTINISGSDYYVGGSGFESGLTWTGPAGSTMVIIDDPQNVTLQHISVNGGNTGIDIQQISSSGGSSFMRYENVMVYGTYMEDPFNKGIQFLNLPRGATVVAEHFTGNMRFTNSSRAKILVNVSWEGAIVVEGSEEIVRDGFLGFLTRFNTNEPFGLYVRDNQNIVIGDYYTEQAEGYWSIEGNPGDPAGYVTVSGIKDQGWTNPEGNINIRNYQGRISCITTQHYAEPPVREILHTGDRPLDLLFMANRGYDPQITFNLGPGANLILIQNQWNGPVDVIPAGGLETASKALDDFRRLGYYDMALNYGDGVTNIQPPVPGPKLRINSAWKDGALYNIKGAVIARKLLPISHAVRKVKQ
jgi:hypothetical protein